MGAAIEKERQTKKTDEVPGSGRETSRVKGKSQLEERLTSPNSKNESEAKRTTILKRFAKRRPDHAKDQVNKTWENAKQLDGNVYDPNTGEIIEWDTNKTRNGQWDINQAKSTENYIKII